MSVNQLFFEPIRISNFEKKSAAGRSNLMTYFKIQDIPPSFVHYLKNKCHKKSERLNIFSIYQKQRTAEKAQLFGQKPPHASLDAFHLETSRQKSFCLSWHSESNKYVYVERYLCRFMSPNGK